MSVRRSLTAAFTAAVAATAAVLAPLPARAYYIVADLDRDGNGIAGPTMSAGTGLPNNTGTTVSVHFSGGFPPPSIPVVPPGMPVNSEIGGEAFVDLATGVMRGRAHAASFGHFETHSLRFAGRMEETIKVTLPSGLPADERVARFVGQVHASGASSNIASATALYALSVGALDVGAALDSQGDWKVIDGANSPFVDIAPLANGYRFELTVAIPQSGQLSISSQLEGTAWAQGRVGFGVGIADVNAMNTALLAMSLPAGASYTSSSGVFLTQPVPEAGSAALMLAGLGALAARVWRRRRVSPPG